jgi:hypothetical protein
MAADDKLRRDSMAPPAEAASVPPLFRKKREMSDDSIKTIDARFPRCHFVAAALPLVCRAVIQTMWLPKPGIDRSRCLT